MKQCPQCHQQFTEAWITFCSNDGSILVEVQQQQAPPSPPPRFDNPNANQANMWLPRQPPSGPGWIAPDERPPMRPVWQVPPPPPFVRAPSQGLAIASMITGIIGFVAGMFCLGPLPGILALVLGLLALSQIKKNPERVGGKPFAIVGIVTGSLNVLFYGFLLVWFIVGAIFN